MHPYDFRLVREFIENGSPCPSESIIKYYVHCKHNEIPVPQPIDDRVTNWLGSICDSLDMGLIPTLQSVFGITAQSNKRKINLHTRIKSDLLLLGKVEEHIGQGLTKEEAFHEVAKSKGVRVGADSVKKACQRAKKNT